MSFFVRVFEARRRVANNEAASAAVATSSADLAWASWVTHVAATPAQVPRANAPASLNDDLRRRIRLIIGSGDAP